MSKFNYKDCINDHFREESCVEKPLTIDENPTIIDKILFKFKTTKSGDICDYCCDDTADNYCEDDCLDPFTFDDITIFYIERNFSNKNTYSSNDTLFHYSDATVVFKIGSPLWTNNVLECPTEEELGKHYRSSSSNPNLSKVVSCPDPNDQLGYKRTSSDEQDPNNLFIKKIDGKVGCFEFVWTPEGVREGDYFICWTYTPYKGASKISNHLKFYLGSSTAVNTSTLLHRTNPQKYIDLLERYIPEMFKEYISDNDLTPNVIEKLNKSLAKGFNVLEDLTNQMVDLLDSNSVNEYIIYYLSNTLNLNLKSNDPTLWRRQIKEAVPLFKKKGTFGSLVDAFEQSGMRLIRVLNYWQVVSPFYYVDSFISSSGVDTFELTKNLVGDEIDVYLSSPTSEKKLNIDEFSLIEEEFSTKIILNNTQITNYILRVEYCYKLPNNDFEKDIAKYIKNLPLMDSREQYISEKPIYPLKNWNIKLIEENDPYIDHIIKTRHPFTDTVIFGKIRTEFPYSENIYNMEEYNASIRDSKNPCDIDKDFLDTCTSCRSSNFDVDLEIQNLCDDRIMEAREIISESTPFHSILRTVNYFGGNNEYSITPLENYEILMTFKYSENNISGGLQRWFHRGRLADDLLQRDDLSEKTLLFSSNISVYNEKVCVFSPDFNFNVIPSNSLIEILTPSIYNGIYTIFNPNNNYVDTSFKNYVNNSTFIFNIFKELYSFSADLVRDDYVELLEEDLSINFSSLDIDNSNKILIDSDIYEIKSIFPNKIILKNNNKINKSFNTKYKILNPDQTVLNLKPNTDTSVAKITYQNRTRVNRFLEIKYKNNYDLKLTFTKNNINYSCPITEYDSEGFFVSNYFGEDVGSLQMKALNYVAKNQIGNFKYNGIKCTLSTPLDSYFLQNYNEYAIKITSENFSNNYYFIYEIQTNSNGYTLSLFGDFEDFGLEDNKVSCACSFYKYKNNTMTIKEQNRNLDEIEAEINRANFSVVEKQTEIKCEGKTNNTNENQLLSVSKNNGPSEASIQKENIFAIIENINGEEKEVNL